MMWETFIAFLDIIAQIYEVLWLAVEIKSTMLASSGAVVSTVTSSI